MSYHNIRQAWQAGRDYARGELMRELARHPDHPPYGAAVMGDNTFAAACYSSNTLAELDLTRVTASDPGDCRAWNLTPYEWAEQIGIAYEAMLWDDNEAKAMLRDDNEDESE